MPASQTFSGTGDPNGDVVGNPGDVYQDQTGALWVNTAAPSTWAMLGSGGGTSTVASLTYRPGSVFTGPSVFNDWAALYAALVALRAAAQSGGQLEVVLDDADASPVVIPTGIYDMTNTAWRGAHKLGGSLDAQRVPVELAVSVQVSHLTLIEGLTISNPETLGPEIRVDGDAEETLTLESVSLDPSGPIVVFAGPGDVALFVGSNCSLPTACGVTESSAPVTVQINGAGSTVTGSSVTVADLGLVNYSLNNAASHFAGTLPPGADTTYTQNTAPITWPFDDGSIQTGGADVDVNTTVLVDGANDQQINLPSIQTTDNGKIIVVKEAEGNAGGVVEITSGGATGGIDGADTVYITQAREAWTFLADVRNDTWRVIQHLSSPLKAARHTDLAVANVETSVLSFRAPANTLKVGTTIKFSMNASRAGANNVSPTVNIRIGPVTLTGSIVNTSGIVATANAGGSHFEGTVVIDAIGIAGNARGEMFSAINSAASAIAANCGRVDAAAIDTTIENIVEITFASGNVGNTYTIRTATLFQYDLEP